MKLIKLDMESKSSVKIDSFQELEFMHIAQIYSLRRKEKQKCDPP